MIKYFQILIIVFWAVQSKKHCDQECQDYLSMCTENCRENCYAKKVPHKPIQCGCGDALELCETNCNATGKSEADCEGICIYPFTVCLDNCKVSKK